MLKTIPENAILIPDIAERVFSGEIFDVYQWPVELFNGEKAIFEMLRRPDTIRTIGVVSGKLLMTEDTQPHRGTVIGFPGGRTNPDDASWAVTAQREVEEETGYMFANWRLLHVVQPEPKNEWFCATFIAWGPEKKASATDEGERVTSRLVDFKDARRTVLETGVLGHMRTIFERAKSLEELLALPAFQGREVDR